MLFTRPSSHFSSLGLASSESEQLPVQTACSILFILCHPNFHRISLVPGLYRTGSGRARLGRAGLGRDSLGSAEPGHARPGQAAPSPSIGEASHAAHGPRADLRSGCRPGPGHLARGEAGPAGEGLGPHLPVRRVREDLLPRPRPPSPVPVHPPAHPTPRVTVPHTGVLLRRRRSAWRAGALRRGEAGRFACGAAGVLCAARGVRRAACGVPCARRAACGARGGTAAYGGMRVTS